MNDGRTYLNEGVNVQHQGLGASDDELVDARNRMGPGHKTIHGGGDTLKHFNGHASI